MSKKLLQVKKCQNCDGVLNDRFKIKYCSNKCQAEEKYLKSLKQWKEGIKSGIVGIKIKIQSSTLRRYLFEKYNNKCSQCGWGERNETSGRIPLEIDHIDGNAENNIEENLRLLCPNCHSLTPYFRNLNKGKGRKWRMEKYIKN